MNEKLEYKIYNLKVNVLKTDQVRKPQSPEIFNFAEYEEDEDIKPV